MTEREDNVYKAKLAEQAERYDGKYQTRDWYMPDQFVKGVLFSIWVSQKSLYIYKQDKT